MGAPANIHHRYAVLGHARGIDGHMGLKALVFVHLCMGVWMHHAHNLCLCCPRHCTATRFLQPGLKVYRDRCAEIISLRYILRTDMTCNRDLRQGGPGLLQTTYN